MDDKPAIKRYEWTDELKFMRPLHDAMFYCCGDVVQYGPFKGMQIPQYPVWDDGNIGCKLFGTYEHELHPFIEMAIERKPKTIVNVGCAEGYYAIGLARLLPDAWVHAFDVNPVSLHQCAEFAAKNGVAERMDFNKGAIHASALYYIDEPILYVVDCEGYEIDLLDPFKCPSLKRADIIVECHDFMVNATSTLTARFVATHNISTVMPVDLPPYFPIISDWPAFLRLLLAIEKRPCNQRWLVMWAK
jgi:hypothetical protein